MTEIGIIVVAVVAVVFTKAIWSAINSGRPDAGIPDGWSEVTTTGHPDPTGWWPILFILIGLGLLGVVALRLMSGTG